MMANVKGALRSVTMWVNGLVGAGVAALPVLRDNFPAMEQYLDHQAYRYAMGAIVAANIALRIKTNGSLADKVQK